MKELLAAILSAYESRGEGELSTKKLGQFLTARFGSVGESKVHLSDLPTIRDAFFGIHRELYRD